MAEEGYSQKEMENLNIEWQKLNDLEFLKKQNIPGPFTSPRDVEKLMRTEPESENENDYYIENWFQRNTSQTLKKVSPVFRLKRDDKNDDQSRTCITNLT